MLMHELEMNEAMIMKPCSGVWLALHLVYLRPSEIGRKVLHVISGKVKKNTTNNFTGSLTKSSILQNGSCEKRLKKLYLLNQKRCRGFNSVFINLKSHCRKDRASLFSLVHTKICIFPFLTLKEQYKKSMWLYLWCFSRLESGTNCFL